MQGTQRGLDQVWRTNPVDRFCAVAVLLAWIFGTVVVTVGDQPVGRGVTPVLWVLAMVLVVGAWRWIFAPFVRLTESVVIVQNRTSRKTIPLDQIASVAPGYYGLLLRLRDGRTINAWAVQKANGDRWLSRRTRADVVADAIRARAGLLPDSPPLL